MDEEFQYPMEKPFRQASKGWEICLMLMSRIGLVGIFLLPLLVQAGEVQQGSEVKRPVLISSEEIRERLEKIRFSSFILEGYYPPSLIESIRDYCEKQDPWFENVGFENRLPESEKMKKKAKDAPGGISSLKDVSANEVLRLVSGLNDGWTEIYKGTIYFLPTGETMEPMQELEFHLVPKNFFPEDTQKTSDAWMDVQARLLDKGLKFWKGGSALYNPVKDILKVTATQSQLKYLEELLKMESQGSKLEGE